MSTSLRLTDNPCKRRQPGEKRTPSASLREWCVMRGISINTVRSRNKAGGHRLPEPAFHGFKGKIYTAFYTIASLDKWKAEWDARQVAKGLPNE